MPSDIYQIDIIHYLNPYFIWVEVVDTVDDKKALEQIGIYGLLAHEITIDLERNELVDISCREWAPATANLMQEFFLSARETWFSPTYIDRRSSIFKDNIHKYGEVVIKTHDGELKKLSEWLITTGFAELNDCEFHKQLMAGKTQLKLNQTQIGNIYSFIDSHYFKKGQDIPCRKTSFSSYHDDFFEVEDGLSALSNNKYQKLLSLMKNKTKSIEDVDNEEESMGRACRRLKINDSHDKPPYNVIKNYFDRLSSSKSSGSDVSFCSDKNNFKKDEVDVVLEKQKIKQDVSKEIDNQVPMTALQKKFHLLKKLSRKTTSKNDTGNMALADQNTNATSAENGRLATNLEDTKKSIEEISSSRKNLTNKMMHKDKLNQDLVSNKEEKEEKNIEKKQAPTSALQRKLQIYKKLSSKPASNDDTASKGTLSDDEVNDIIEKINIAYPKNDKKKLVKEVEDDTNNLDFDNGVENIGSYMCNFVEKLVTPVVMVHSKFNKVIKPVYAMRDIPFNQHIHIVLKNMSVKLPMDLQSISWQTILRGHSIFMISPKDSGKTMGYLPCVCRLVSDGTPEMDSSGPICIVVCATAESVTVVERIAKMLLGLHEKVLACYAGVDELFITTSLLNRCDLLICTPPALVRILQDRDFGVDLRRLRAFVLDDCERLDQAYKQEVKFFHYKIREVEKTRANKELKVQYVVASRVWCDFMESLARRAPDSVISIGSFTECVLYSKASMSVSFVGRDKKVNSVIEFLNDTDSSKKLVIVCRHNDDVAILEKEMKYLGRYIFVGHNDLTVSEMYNLGAAWRDYEVPILGPILICTDDSLSHLNITDANYLVHYSLPNSFSLFRKRFSVLNDNYPSIFSAERKSVKIKILLEDVDTEKLPKILNFIKRCTDNVPLCLDELSNKILAKRDISKAKKLVPICGALLSLGYCPDFYDCLNRHKILKEYDEPTDWIPKRGTVTFKILHYHTATSYSVRLLTHIEKSEEIKFPKTYNTLSLKLGMYYGKASNRKLHGIPKVGDICAVSVKYNLFARCQVVKILSTYQRGNPNYVLINLLDEERYERSRDIYLYHLPKEFKEIKTYVVQVRLANVQPKDRDVTFSNLAKDHVKNLVNAEEDIYVRSNIVGVIGNCIFVDTLEACQELSSLDEIVVKHNLKRELLEKHAEDNPDHITKLKELCLENDYTMIVEKEVVVELKKSTKKVVVDWAHLDKDEVTGVYVSSIISPDQFFVRLAKFEPCMKLLLMDIKKHIEGELEPFDNIQVGDIVITKFPEDDTYERARVDGIEKDTVKCFFVDQGDWEIVALKDVYPITNKLISQLPFQSIECRLIGIKSPGNTWTDFCINWLSNYSEEGTKHLYAKYFLKEPAEITGANKYAIALIDTNTEDDVIVNQLMVDLNLAQKVEEEITYLDSVIAAQPGESEVNDKEEWTELSKSTGSSVKSEDFQKVSLSKVFLPLPKRSVPLVDSDCESDSSDKWEVFNPKDLLATFVPQIQAMANTSPELPTISPNNLKTDLVESSNERTPARANDLDSDDTMTDTPGNSSLNENNLTIIDQTRKPKLIWRQNKTSVSIKIQLIGIERYELVIEDRSLKFKGFIHDTNYSFNFDLYAVVEKNKCSHSNKGQYILVKLAKVLHKNWMTLTKDPEIKKWIVYDVDGLEASSDEEVLDDSLVKIAKEMHYKHESESDDDDFVDDVNYRYK
ncbi:putative ATP-dependent RNA helicase TDRD12 [Zerene cesonia]|uniref:putative ATP-dependent RNA helicase TDRD12 n=1 Tax=Zerene cesonia TaxID=33412 RepID=UPI0018E515E2|nr:putative ATP-dependent RNA helicase TDRD12 [Zerene cesonia]